jgi:hypothetical protein
MQKVPRGMISAGTLDALGNGSDSTLNLIRTEASGTNIDRLGGTVYDCLDFSNVGLPRLVGSSVGVGNLDAKGHALAANITLCHEKHLLTDSVHKTELL